MNVTLTHSALAGSAENDPNALRPLLDGVKHTIETYSVGEVLAGLSLKTIRGTGQEGDTLTVFLEGFNMCEDTEIELDLSVGTVFADEFTLLSMGVEPGSSAPPATVSIQSNRDLTATSADALVLLTRGAVAPPQE